MPLDHHILPDQALVLVEGTGVLSDADVLGAQEQIRADRDRQHHYSELVDLQRVTSIEVSSDTIRQLARQDLWDAHSRRAFVVTPGIAYGLARMFEMLIEGRAQDIRIFTAMPEARQWLGLRET